MSMSTISSKGQITLPAALRRKLGIRARDRVTVELADDAIIIKLAANFLELEGFLGKALPPEVERKHLLKTAAAHGRGGRA